jgi:hypothetical protein
MEDAIANRYIGYDQTDRLSLYIQAHAHNWSIKSIITPVECDCSSLVAVCLNCAGIHVPADVYTGNLAAACAATGLCYILRDKLLLERSDYLLRGDILLNSAHHAAVVLSNGSRATGIRITPYPAVVNVRTYLQVRTAPDGEEKMLSGQSMRLPAAWWSPSAKSRASGGDSTMCRMRGYIWIISSGNLHAEIIQTPRKTQV